MEQDVHHNRPWARGVYHATTHTHTPSHSTPTPEPPNNLFSSLEWVFMTDDDASIYLEVNIMNVSTPDVDILILTFHQFHCWFCIKATGETM